MIGNIVKIGNFDLEDDFYVLEMEDTKGKVGRVVREWTDIDSPRGLSYEVDVFDEDGEVDDIWIYKEKDLKVLEKYEARVEEVDDMERKFEIISKYKGILGEEHLPQRADEGSAGYDFRASEDIVIPSILGQRQRAMEKLGDLTNRHSKDVSSLMEGKGSNEVFTDEELRVLDIVSENSISIEGAEFLTKFFGLRGTLVPTGIKAQMQQDKVLKLYPRSSVGVKLLLTMPNDVGIIDSSYYDNEDNEGHIFVPYINLLPFDIKIKKGERIAQGIFVDYYEVGDDKVLKSKRTGGIGSSDR